MRLFFTKTFLLFFSVTLFFSKSFAQNNVGIGTLTPDASAVLELSSTSQGFLPSRMDSTQMISIVSPAKGLMVYNTTDNCFWYNNGTNWDNLCKDSLKTDSLILTYAVIDSLIASYISADTIISKYAMFDTLIASYGKFDTIVSKYGSFDSLKVGGKSIDSLISGIVDTTAWKLKGNSGTSPAINFIGTTDSTDWVIRTNNTERMRVQGNGNVGIGTSAPTQTLDVDGSLRFRTGANKSYILTSDSIGNATWQHPDSVKVGGSSTTSYEVIWSGYTNLNNSTQFLIFGKKFSDYKEILFLTRTGNFGRIPQSMFSNIKGLTTDRGVNDLWKVEVFSGDDSGHIGIAHITDTSFRVASYRSGSTHLIRVYGIK